MNSIKVNSTILGRLSACLRIPHHPNAARYGWSTLRNLMEIWDTLLNLIKRDKENAQAKTGHPFEPYWSIIDAALAKRRSEPMDVREDKVHKVPVYIVRMCESLVKAIKANGNPDATVAEVISLELNASGHSDYHQKFALYCFELAQKKPR